METLLIIPAFITIATYLAKAVAMIHLIGHIIK
jgi:hypothetical protein